MKIYIVGQDERSVKLRELYEKDKVKLEDADVVVCPIPFSKDIVNINNSDMTIEDMILKLKNSNKTLVSGAIKDSVINKLKENNINVIDLLDYEQYSIKNAVATSEGAIKKAILTEKTSGEQMFILLTVLILVSLTCGGFIQNLKAGILFLIISIISSLALYLTVTEVKNENSIIGKIIRIETTFNQKMMILLRTIIMVRLTCGGFLRNLKAGIVF